MFTQQNSKENLTYLRAMRYYYSKAKNIRKWILIVSIIIPISFMIYRYLINIEKLDLTYGNGIISLALLWILGAYFLEKRADDFVKIGSKIQEKFDINIFDLPNNDGLVYEDVSYEIIYDGNQLFKGDENSLKDWYATRKVAPHYLKVLIAQRMNIMWGSVLKEKYKKLVFTSIVIILLFPIILSAWFNLNFVDSIIFLILPFIPLLYIALKSYIKLSNQIDNNKIINTKILNDCKTIDGNTVNRCRMYQDYIYIENRLNSVLIPDWFYKRFRDDMNDKLIETNDKILDEYKS